MAPPTHSPAALNARGQLHAEISGALDRARINDPPGHQVHTLLAMLHLFALPLSTAAGAIAFGLLTAWSIIRLPRTWRSYGHFLRTPVSLAMIAWPAWLLASFLWTPDRHQAFDELAACRAFILVMLVWPVMDRLPWLLGAALAGLAAQNLVQFMQALEWIEPPEKWEEGRYGGRVTPNKTGAWCAAAMCWHLSAVLRARGAQRLIWAVGFVLAAAGLILTESRGAWIAAAVAVPLTLLAVIARRPDLHKIALVVMLVGVVGSAIAYPLCRKRIAARFEVAAQESRDARERGVYWTSVGLRVGFTRWSWEMVRQHPVRGVGAGGYATALRSVEDYQAAVARARNDNQRDWLGRSHPHSMYLYALACTGVIGAAIVFVLLCSAIVRAWVDVPDHVFADGTLMVMIVWMIGAGTDCYNLNAQLLSILALAIAVTLPHRPKVRMTLAARDPGETVTGSTASPAATR